MPPNVRQFQDYDFSEDVSPPKVVHQQLKAHDERMRKVRDDLALIKATFGTDYWKHLRGTKDKDETAVEIEVNRIRGAIGSYLAALYPRANRVVLAADPAGRGDPVKTQLALNRWLQGQRIHSRVMSALRQSLLYPGCGAKVGYYPGRGNPLDRVWMRIIPWWEMVLDADAGDVEDERFRGHAYHRPKVEIEREYGLEGKLTGTRRRDFLSEMGSTADTKAAPSGTASGKADSDESAFVRMLEVCNLRDLWKDPRTGTEYLGRMEVYVLEQGELSKHPIHMGPLPFTKTDSDPLPHIEPLIFNTEPEFPLRGISGVKHLMPQQRELNVFRTFMATSARKDTRQYVVRKGALPADALTKLSAGIDGLIIEVPEDYTGALSDIVHLVQTGNISGNVINYMGVAERDFDRGLGASPNARGQITKATAFEVQTTQLYTESEFGLHGAIKDEWLSRVVRLAQRALIAAMQDTGDSAGAYEGQAVDLAPVGARPDDGMETPAETTDVAAQVAADATATVTAGPAPLVDEAAADGGKVTQTPGTASIKQQVLALRDRDNVLEVAVPDLDADFEISFVEGGRTPLTDAAMQQNLVALMGPYSQLAEAAGIPKEVVAGELMQAIADRFELPKQLHPDELAAKVAAKKKEPKPEPAKAATADAPPDPSAVLSRIAALPPEEALQALATLAEGNPELTELVQRAAALPPEAQAEAVAAILAQLGAESPANSDPAMAAMEGG